MPITGATVTISTKLTNPITKAPEDPTPGALTLLVIDPNGKEDTYVEGELVDDGVGLFHKSIIGNVTGLWHYRWLVNGSTADEGTFPMESEFDAEFTEPEGPDLTDLRVLVPRARRKVEGPWGNPSSRPPLSNTQIYEMVGDAVGEVVMLGGSVFGHELIVKKRDPLGGFPVAWKTDTPLSEYETAIICAQVALNYYYYLFRDMKISETIQNEGTVWTYELSANVIRNYLESLRAERDQAIQGLRINRPVLDQYASNIRVRDQATVTVLEWWATGGLPGGQEASVIPWFSGDPGIV